MLQQTQQGAARSVAPEFPSGVPARSTATPGRFRRRTTLDDASDRSGLVARAIARGKEGDPEAIRFLYQRYADNVYGYVCSIVRDEHEAEDVTQNVFAKLMTNLSKYEPRAVPFSAWILRVARNAAMDHLRARRMIPCEEVRDPAAHADDTGSLRRASLRQALGDLPDEQRRVLVLRHLVGLSPGEIAESMGKTEGSVHALHHRGRRSLQQSLVRLEAAPSLRAVPAAVPAAQ
jgi:RNA polymerase sigma-70 factor, ECF subfamily